MQGKGQPGNPAESHCGADWWGGDTKYRGWHRVLQSEQNGAENTGQRENNKNENEKKGAEEKGGGEEGKGDATIKVHLTFKLVSKKVAGLKSKCRPNIYYLWQNPRVI